MTGLLMRFLRDIRLVPIVLIATIALFGLKALGLYLDAGYLFENRSDIRDKTELAGARADPEPAGPKPVGARGKELPAVAKPSWAQQRFNFPGGSASVGSAPSPAGVDITGSTGATPSPPTAEIPPANGDSAAKNPQEPSPVPNGVTVPLDLERPVSPAERAILESLQKRRTELDARAHELDVREDLLRAAEKRVGGRIDELKDLEARVNAALQQKDDAEAARLKNVVTMYENMKAKDAAKIFDGLDIKVLLDVVKEINPRRMSDILAQMTPENAQRLTVELAVRSAQKDQAQTADLPKIQGQPNPN